MDSTTSMAAKPLPTLRSYGEDPIPKTDCEIVERLDNLKPEINQFLYKWLPKTATIEDMEKIGTSMYLRIEEEWKRKAGLIE